MVEAAQEHRYRSINDVTRHELIEAMRLSNGNQTIAAQALGLKMGVLNAKLRSDKQLSALYCPKDILELPDALDLEYPEPIEMEVVESNGSPRQLEVGAITEDELREAAIMSRQEQDLMIAALKAAGFDEKIFKKTVQLGFLDDNIGISFGMSLRAAGGNAIAMQTMAVQMVYELKAKYLDKLLPNGTENDDYATDKMERMGWHKLLQNYLDCAGKAGDRVISGNMTLIKITAINERKKKRQSNPNTSPGGKPKFSEVKKFPGKKKPIT